jgi:hypothetical protein
VVVVTAVRALPFSVEGIVLGCKGLAGGWSCEESERLGQLSVSTLSLAWQADRQYEPLEDYLRANNEDLSRRDIIGCRNLAKAQLRW